MTERAAETGDVGRPDNGPAAIRYQLDGVRALCIIFTIFNHVPGRPYYVNGSVGVDVFFALSGWLITWLLLQERQKTATIRLSSFYIRRAFRIIPLYALTIALYGAIVYTVRPGDVSNFQAALPYLSTFNFEYRTAAAGNLFGHAWTLSIEEKFYLLWPIILLFTPRRPGRALVAGLICITILMMIGVNSYIIRGYFGLSIGAATAMLVHLNPGLQAFLRRTPIAGWLLAAMALPYGVSVVYPELVSCNLAISLLGAPMIASLWFNGEQTASKALSWKPLAWLGALTYAIYLLQTVAINAAVIIADKLHLPSGGWFIFIYAYAISICGAWVVHVIVEKPMIKIGKTIAGRRARPGPSLAGAAPAP